MIINKAELIERAPQCLHVLIEADVLWATKFEHGIEVRHSWLIDLTEDQSAACLVLKHNLSV